MICKYTKAFEGMKGLHVVMLIVRDRMVGGNRLIEKTSPNQCGLLENEVLLMVSSDTSTHVPTSKVRQP